MSARRSIQVAAYMARCNARMGLTRVGVLALAVIPLLGSVASVSRGGGWALDEELFLYGFLVAALLGIRSGLEEQRERALDTFLRLNLVTPLEHAMAVVISLLLSWATLCVLAFLVALLLSADPARAAWSTGSLASRSALLLPLVPPVEAKTRLRAPLVVPVLAFLALVLGLAAVAGEATMLRVLGSPGEPGDLESLLPLAARSAVVLVVGLGLVLGGSAVGVRSRPVRPWDRPA